MYKILISDKLGEAGIALLEEEQTVTFDLKTDLSHEQLVNIIDQYDALIVRSATQANRELILAGDKLKVIGRAGVGIDNIDIEAATSKGIIVMNTPNANSIATAEHAMTMLLACARLTGHAHQHVAQGKWEKSKFTGVQLYRKTLGLIGLGRIARRVAAYAKAFDMKVIAYDPYVSESIASEHNVQMVNFEELLSQSDFISLHTVVNDETDSIINKQTLAMTKPGAMIINSARGKLIDEQALAQALDSGQIKRAAVDVYRQEPPSGDHPLIGRDDVLHLPHLGASTEEAQTDVARQIGEQVVDALNQIDFKNSVNIPFQIGSDFDEIKPFLNLSEKIGSLHYYMADQPIKKIEIHVNDESSDKLVKPVACGVLKGLLDHIHNDSVNYISAPLLGESHGIALSQAHSHSSANYSSLISVTCHYKNGQERLISGTLFDKHPRIVQISHYHLDIDPSGLILLMLNHDRPGVIGRVGTLLSDNNVNIAQWRLGRTDKNQQAMAFINLDSKPDQATLDQINAIDDVIKIKLIDL